MSFDWATHTAAQIVFSPTQSFSDAFKGDTVEYNCTKFIITIILVNIIITIMSGGLMTKTLN